MRSERTDTVAIVAIAGAALAAVLTLRAQQPTPATGAMATRASLEAAATINNLGVARLEQYDYAAAVDEFRRATTLAPDFVLARINLAIALFYQNRHADADQEARAALALRPDSPQAHYMIGLIARVANEPDRAAEAFRRVLAVDPDDTGARIGLGQVLMQQRQFGAAADAFAAAARAEPFNVTAAYNLASALTRAGRTDEGRAEMARFTALRESGQGIGFTSNYLEQGRYAEALVSTGLEPGLVSREAPAVRFTASRLVAAPGDAGRSEATGGAVARGGLPAVTLADLDADGDLDLLVTGRTADVLRNDGGRFTRWDGSGISRDVLATASGVVVADGDNDASPDVFVAGIGGVRWFRQHALGRFEDQTSASGLSAVKADAAALSLGDIDHDGDLDLVIGGRGGLALVRNNGNGTFADVTTASKVAVSSDVRAIVPTDIDNRRDLDLLVAGADADVRVLRNQRDGTFAEQPLPAGQAGPAALVVAADFNKDDLPDLATAGSTIDVALSRGSTLTARQTVARVGGVTALQALDVDNDGLLDLVALTGAGLRVLRFTGDGWADVTASVAPASAGTAAAPNLTAMASGDVDGDGDTDIVTTTGDGTVALLTNAGADSNRSFALRLTGRVSNRSGVGAKVELRAGGLRQRVETVAAAPSPRPADVSFGLGGRSAVDVVRVIWPSGVVQSEVLDVTAPAGRPLALTELDRKPSSCPFLYTWNGERFEFVTDFLGAGEMGYWVAPGVRSVPDPDEYVRIPPGSLAARDGRFDLRITNELEETLYLDRLQLVSVTHPAGTAVFANEGMRSRLDPFALYIVPTARPVRRAIDDAGRDVTDRLARVDRRYVDALPLLPIRGYAETHILTLDLSDPPRTGGGAGAEPRHTRSPQHPGAGGSDGRVVLLLTGWTDYAFSSDNVAAAQAGLALHPPSLQVRDRDGAWRTVIDEVGVPVGRPQTVVVDLTDRFLTDDREVRLVTSMRIYWDEARVASGAARVTPDPARARFDRPTAAGRVVVSRHDAERAILSWRGFSAERRRLAGEVDSPALPLTYDFARVSPASPWKQMPGRYTRAGDVRELLVAGDDRFVISMPGDALSVEFEASAVTDELPRTHFLFAGGYSKEMDINSASPDVVGPLPWRSMTGYPGGASGVGASPSAAQNPADMERYHTRVVGRTLPILEAALPVRRDGRTNGEIRR